MKKLIYGMGGHGRVVEDTLKSINKDFDIIFFDDYFNPYNRNNWSESELVIAIGDNEVRRKLVEGIGHRFMTIIHPSAYVSPYALLGEGTVVLANAVVQTGASIGSHCIINANVTIDHDAIVEDYVSIYPGSYVPAKGVVKEGSVIPPGTIVRIDV